MPIKVATLCLVARGDLAPADLSDRLHYPAAVLTLIIVISMRLLFRLTIGGAAR